MESAGRGGSRSVAVLTGSRNANADHTPAVEACWSGGELTFRDLRVFGPGGGEHAHRFLRRVLAIPEVRSVRIDRAGGTALVRLDRNSEGVPRRLVASV